MVSNEYKKGGNSLIFGFWFLFNTSILIFGTGELSLGIYSCEIDNTFEWYNGSFLIIGFFQIIISLFGHIIRYSPYNLFIYILSLSVILIMHTTFSLLVASGSNINLESTDFNGFYLYLHVQQGINLLFCSILAGAYWKTLEKSNKPILSESELKTQSNPFVKI